MDAPLNFARHGPEQAMQGSPHVPTRRQRVHVHRGQGEKPRNDQRGLTYAATPASDFICGAASIEDVGWELFHLMLGVARGRKQTWAER